MSQKISVKWLVIILVLSMSSTAQAEYPVVEWTRQLGTVSNDESNDVSVDGSGNAYITGYTEGDIDGNTSTGYKDIFLTKYDTAGTKLWTKQLGTDSYDYGNDVSVDGSGNAYVTGRTYGGLDGNTSAGGCDMFLAKYDKNGTKMWTEQLGTTGTDLGCSVSVDGSGNAYVTGGTYGGLDDNTSAGGRDAFLVKYDTAGTKLWTKQLGTAEYDQGFGVSVDGSGNAYVSGCTYDGLDGNTYAGFSDMFLTKYDTNGTKLWTRQLGTGSRDESYDVSVDGSGNAYVTGYTEGDIDGNISAGDNDMFLTKYDTDGTKLWTQQLGTAYFENGYGVSVDGSGNAYVTGVTNGSLDGNTHMDSGDMFLIKYDKDGNKLWTCQLGTASSDVGHGVSVDCNGNAYVSGQTEGDLNGNTNAGGRDVFLVKISAIPEPSSIVMLFCGLVSLIYLRRWR